MRPTLISIYNNAFYNCSLNNPFSLWFVFSKVSPEVHAHSSLVTWPIYILLLFVLHCKDQNYFNLSKRQRRYYAWSKSDEMILHTHFRTYTEDVTKNGNIGSLPCNNLINLKIMHATTKLRPTSLGGPENLIVAITDNYGIDYQLLDRCTNIVSLELLINY